ncbi:hypothetical protein [Gimesia aquarii]|uniref:Uncharacterized protein n=1 Tax=Gimesia aquarii TaxID=2527964 RepID=A0A517VRN9_9PLAN|nr:hypothetical protein [Gimesia aquarii]QDT95672.1 hypothetical protein V144x_11190 [Gimesia aquarii]
MHFREIFRKRLFWAFALFFLLFAGLMFLITRVQKAQQAAYDSMVMGQLSYLSISAMNYKDLKGSSVFNDAQKQGVSWRVLLAEALGKELLDGVQGSGNDRTTPNFLRDREKPGLLRLLTGSSSSVRLTSFRAVKLNAESNQGDHDESTWMFAYLPMKQDHWLSTTVIPQAQLEELIMLDNGQTILCKIPEERMSMRGAQFLNRVQADASIK